SSAAPCSAVTALGTAAYLCSSSSNGARQREPESERAPSVEPWYDVMRERNSILPGRSCGSQYSTARCMADSFASEPDELKNDHSRSPGAMRATRSARSSIGSLRNEKRYV